jgi:flagellar biosynthesis protein
VNHISGIVLAGNVPMIDITDDGDEEESEKDRLLPRNISKRSEIPTAVALRGIDEKRRTPEIAAAGRGYLAEKILELAFENGIRVREDSDLAEMLAALEIDSPIPPEAFMAVAEILHYVYIANGKHNPFDVVLNNAQDSQGNS